MGKRFTDTEKWRKPFVRTLTVEEKLFWFYLLDKCSNAGIWTIDFELAQFEIGISLDQNYLTNKFREKIQVIDGGRKWFIPSFLEFQQPKGLSDSGNYHKPILDELKKYNLQYIQHTGKSLSTLDQELTNSTGLGTGNGTGISTGNNEGVGLLYDEKHKDFDKFVEQFPQGKRDYDPHSLTIWENLSQRDKDLCIQLTPHYVEFHTKTGKEKYIKNIKKFLEEGFYKQLNEFQSRYLGKKVLIHNSTTTETPEQKKERLSKMIWG